MDAEDGMKSPLFPILIVILTAFFGFSWVMLAGSWLGLGAFSADRYVIGELMPLAYGGAGLSVIFLFTLVAAKLHYK